MSDSIAVNLSGRDKPINLKPFESRKDDGRVNTYFQVSLPKKDGTTYPASRGISPVILPDGLTTSVDFDGVKVPMATGKTGSGNRKVSGRVDLVVDERPMVGSAEISELAGGKFWVRFSVTNPSGGGFKAKTTDEVDALLFG